MSLQVNPPPENTATYSPCEGFLSRKAPEHHCSLSSSSCQSVLRTVLLSSALHTGGDWGWGWGSEVGVGAGRSAYELSRGRIANKFCSNESGSLHPHPTLYPQDPLFQNEKSTEVGSKTTPPYGEGKPGVLGDAPEPGEDEGAPAAAGGQPSPPEGSVLPRHPEGIRHVVIFQFPENLQARGGWGSAS